MNKSRPFEDLLTGFHVSGDIIKDAMNLLIFHQLQEVSDHSHKVAIEAENLALRFGVDRDKALMAGYLHDIGNMIPHDEMVDVAVEVGIEVLEEERVYPPLLHQKLSKTIVAEVFGIKDPEILNAVECHTTLKGNPGHLDMVLFIADKMQWDPKHSGPFLDGVLKGLERSLEAGVFAYVKYCYDQRQQIKVLHPWLADAYNYLNEMETIHGKG